MLIIADDLHEQGIGLRILTGKLAGTYIPSGEGKFFFTMMAAFAELERDIIHERTTVLANTRYPLMSSPVMPGWGSCPASCHGISARSQHGPMTGTTSLPANRRTAMNPGYCSAGPGLTLVRRRGRHSR